MTEDVKPWERQPWESAAAYRAFHDYYLSQEVPRSINEAYRRYKIDQGSRRGKVGVAPVRDPAAVRGWEDLIGAQPKKEKTKNASGRWRTWAAACYHNGRPVPGGITWTQRAAAWDAHLAEGKRALWRLRYEEMRELDWQAAGKLRGLAVEALEKNQVEPGRIDHLARALELAAKVGRLATGDPVSVETPDEEEDAAGLSDADRLSRITALLDAARARRTGQAAAGEQPVGAEPRPADGSVLQPGG